MNDDDVLEKAKQLRAAGVPLAEIEAYVASKRGADPMSDLLRERDLTRATGKLPGPELTRRKNLRINQNEAEAAAIPDDRASILGGVSALTPGPLRAVAAGARSNVRGALNRIGLPVQPESYRQSLQEIEGAQADNPVSGFNRAVGSTIAMMAAPGSTTARQGALYGALEGATDPNPDRSRVGRAGYGLLGATVGGLSGKVADVATTANRVRRATPLDEAALGRKDVMRSTDQANFGRVADEARAAGGTSPEIQASLAKPDIAPVVAMLRESRQFRSADDATLLREAYKHLGEAERGAGARVAPSDNTFRAGSQFEKREIGLAKQELAGAAEAPTPDVVIPAPVQRPDLRTAVREFDQTKIEAGARRAGTVEQQRARMTLERHSMEPTPAPAAPTIIPGEPVMPSFRTANREHARLAGEADAGARGARVAKHVLAGKSGPQKKLTSESPAAFRRSVQDMTPGEATAATEDFLGAANESGLVRGNLATGAFRTSARAGRAQSMLDELDPQSLSPDVLRVLRGQGLRGVPAEMGRASVLELLRRGLPASGVSLATP